jgi:hypothetical protein
VTSFVQSVAQAACDWEFRCCKDEEIKARDTNKYTTAAQCLPYAQLAAEDALYIDRLAVSEGRLRLDSTHANACITQMKSRMCNPAPGSTPPPMMSPTVDECAKAFTGNTAVGSECINPKECVSGAHCVTDGTTSGRGVCVPFQKVGDICNTDADCDPTVTNIYCAQQDFKCHVKSKVGEPCAYTTDAAGTNPTLPLLLVCDTSTTTDVYCDPTSNTCKQFPDDGQPCLPSPLPPGVASRCNPDPTQRVVCDTSGTCRAPGKAGADCSTVGCDVDFYCARTGTTAICTALPSLGASCVASGRRCAMPYFCNVNTNVCDQPAQLGESCVQKACDTGLYCDMTTSSYVCKSQLSDGSPCTSPVQCVSENCSGYPGTCQPGLSATSCTGR